MIVITFCHCFRAECESHVKGFAGARFKKFATENEAESFASGSTSGYSGYSTAPTQYVSIYTTC